MRTVEATGLFRRDLKRVLEGPMRRDIERELDALVERIAADMPLDVRHRDHPLAGNWADHRDCHVRPDLVLIYRKPDPETLQLVRLGSHSALRL